jgi:hypothetical protein
MFRASSRHGLRPRFIVQTPPLLLVGHQIRTEASEFQDQYIAVRIVPGNRRRLSRRTFFAIHRRASRFRAVQELELPQHELDMNSEIRDTDVQRHPNSYRVTRGDLPALRTVVWTTGRNLSRQEQEETVEFSFDRPGLRIMDREPDGDDDEWIDEEWESDEDNSMDEDNSTDDDSS